MAATVTRALVGVGQEAAHQIGRKSHKRRRLLADEAAEYRRRPHRFPIEDPHVPAVFVARHQRMKLAADEFGERIFARHRLDVPGMRELILGQRAERHPQNFAVKPVLAVEMIVDRGLVHARFGDDGADAGAVIAAFGEQPLGRFQDALAGDFGWPRHA